jgi:hypothetical protein
MTPRSRTFFVRPLVLPLALAVVVGLGGCGNDSPSAKPTPTGASTVTSATPTPTSTPTRDAGDAQVVKIRKYGISFELPKGWITLDAKKVLRNGGKNSVLDELAGRMGTTPDQLVKTWSDAVQTFSVSDEGARHGFLDNVNSVGQNQVLNDDAIRLQLATIGAKPATFAHSSSPAGDVTRIPYDLPTKVGLTVRGVAVVVYTADATVVVTVSSSSAASAAKIADQIVASLDQIPGSGPNA